VTTPRLAALLFLFISFLSLAARPALSATLAPLPTETEIYCSGIVSRLAPRPLGSVVSGEDAIDKLQFFQGDAVYLHLAAHSAAHSAPKPGEQFLVVRAAKDPTQIPWFRGEKRLERRMGRLWDDIGRVRVIKLAGRVTIARVESSCVPMKRGDLLLAFEPRPAPPLPAPGLKDVFAAPASPVIGRVVSAKDFRQILGAGYIAYVDLGKRQGVKVGDRLLLFRHPGQQDDEVYQMGEAAARPEGFGHSRPSHGAGRLPREILGEAVVLRVSRTAATILITSSRREIELGDYAARE